MKKFLTVLLTVMIAFTTFGINVLAETEVVEDKVAGEKLEKPEANPTVFTVTGVTVPVVGQTATTLGVSVTSTGDGTIDAGKTSVKWKHGKDDFTGVFAAGETYTIEIKCVAVDKNEFTENGSATVNGSEAALDCKKKEAKITKSYELAALTVIYPFINPTNTDYTGSEITDVPTVTFNKASDGTGEAVTLTKDVDYTAAFAKTVEDAGDYAVVVTLTGASSNYQFVAGDHVTANVTFTVNKVNSSFTTDPALVTSDLTYNGDSQNLITAGVAVGGDAKYIAIKADSKPADPAIEDLAWSTDVPQGEDAGTYHIWYRIAADKNHNDYQVTYLGAKSIAKKNVEYTAPTPKLGLKADGSAKDLVEAGSSTEGTVYYYSSTSQTGPSDPGDWSIEIPQGTEANTYYVWFKVVATDQDNYNDYVALTYITSTIASGEVVPIDIKGVDLETKDYTYKNKTSVTPKINGLSNDVIKEVKYQKLVKGTEPKDDKWVDANKNYQRVDAGEYKVLITLKNGYIFEDVKPGPGPKPKEGAVLQGPKEDKEILNDGKTLAIKFKINPIELKDVVLNNNKVEYNGRIQKPVLHDVNENLYYVDSDDAFILPKKYERDNKVKFTLKDRYATNYKFVGKGASKDGKSVELDYEITKAFVSAEIDGRSTVTWRENLRNPKAKVQTVSALTRQGRKIVVDSKYYDTAYEIKVADTSKEKFHWEKVDLCNQAGEYRITVKLNEDGKKLFRFDNKPEEIGYAYYTVNKAQLAAPVIEAPNDRRNPTANFGSDSELHIANFYGYPKETEFKFYTTGKMNFGLLNEIEVEIAKDGSFKLEAGTYAVKAIAHDNNHVDSNPTKLIIAEAKNKDEKAFSIDSQTLLVGTTNITISSDYPENPKMWSPKLIKVEIDGKALKAHGSNKEYTVKYASTHVTLSEAYAKTLAVGSHTVEFHYDDGLHITGNLNIVAPAPTPKKKTFVTPKTGVEY